MKFLTLLFFGILLAVFPKVSYADYSCTGTGITSSGTSCSSGYCSGSDDTGRTDINACGTSFADSISCTSCGAGTCNASSGLCNIPTPTFTPSPTPTPTPILTPTRTPTPTITPIPTKGPFSPTATPFPTLTPTPTILAQNVTTLEKWGGIGPECVENGVATLSCLPSILALIINALLIFGGLTGLIFLIIGSYKYINSKGDPKAYEGAKNTILYGIIGLLVVFLAFFILNFISYVTQVGCITKIGFGC